MHQDGMPKKQGLYDPRFERDSCGVGFVVNVDGTRSHRIIRHPCSRGWKCFATWLIEAPAVAIQRRATEREP